MWLWMQHEETDVKTHKHAVLACLIAAVCRNGSSHGQGGSRLHHRRPNWLLPQPNGLLIPPDRGSSPLFRVYPAGSWEQLSFPRVLINPAPPCISYNKQSKLNRLVYEDSRQLGCPALVLTRPRLILTLTLLLPVKAPLTLFFHRTQARLLSCRAIHSMLTRLDFFVVDWCRAIVVTTGITVTPKSMS